MRPSRWLIAALCLLALPGAALAFGLIGPGPLLSAAVALLVAAVLDLLRLRLLPSPSLERRVPRIVAVGHPLQVELAFSAPPALAGARIEVFDLHPPQWPVEDLPQALDLPAEGRRVLGYRLHPDRRGHAAFSGCALRLHSPWRLWTQLRVLPVASQIRVYPDFARVSHLALGGTDRASRVIGAHHQQSAGNAGVGHRQRRAEGLRHHRPRLVPRVGHLDVPVQADAQPVAQRVDLRCARRREPGLDFAQPLFRAKRIAVALSPEPLALVAERGAEIGERIDLPRGGLAGLPVHRREVVAPDGRRAGGHRAGRPLGVVAGIARHTVLGRDLGADHLEQVELRRDLEQRALVGRVGVHRADVAGDLRNAQRAVRRPACAGHHARRRVAQGRNCSGAQLGHRRQLEPADAVRAAVRPRVQALAAHLEPRAGLLPGQLAKACQPLEPVHVHSPDLARGLLPDASRGLHPESRPGPAPASRAEPTPIGAHPMSQRSADRGVRIRRAGISLAMHRQDARFGTIRASPPASMRASPPAAGETEEIPTP